MKFSILTDSVPLIQLLRTYEQGSRPEMMEEIVALNTIIRNVCCSSPKNGYRHTGGYRVMNRQINCQNKETLGKKSSVWHSEQKKGRTLLKPAYSRFGKVNVQIYLNIMKPSTKSMFVVTTKIPVNQNCGVSGCDNG